MIELLIVTINSDSDSEEESDQDPMNTGFYFNTEEKRGNIEIKAQKRRVYISTDSSDENTAIKATTSFNSENSYVIN